MSGLLATLEMQRHDDHRYYHHSRINQCLHLFSGVSFLCCYALLFKNAAAAALIGWLVAMLPRQIGHFFFEPQGYDEVNRVSHEHKEAIKVGYNLKRKAILLLVWAASPFALLLDPSLFNLLTPGVGTAGFVANLGLVWLAVAVGALAFRTIQLMIVKDATTGAAWLVKILTDPLNDIRLYHRAPLQLLRGQLLDPMESDKRT